ncbi:MAG: hypothetical protein MUE82_07500 [Chloroflexi bacterium]|jgi:uncharacterized membrane protein|nr:hypothetical protein [Chloroflexota bacterium]
MADLLGTRTIFVCRLESRGAAEALDAELEAWARSRQVALLDVATAYRAADGRLKLERGWDWWSIAAAAGGVVLAPTIVGALIAGAVAGGGTTLARRKIGRRMSTNMVKRVASHLDAGRALYLVAVKAEYHDVMAAWLAERGVDAIAVALDAAAEAEILEALGAPVPAAAEGPGGPVATAPSGRMATGVSVPPTPGTVRTWGEMFGTGATGAGPAAAAADAADETATETATDAEIDAADREPGA